MTSAKAVPADGPVPESGPASAVLSAVFKRLRNARKRLRGIDEIQAKRDAGMEINADQVRMAVASSGSTPVARR